MPAPDTSSTTVFGDITGVNTTTLGGQTQAASTLLDDGKFVVVWVDGSQTGLNDIRAQMFNADGSTFGDEFVISSGTDQLPFRAFPKISTLADGKFVVTWGGFAGGGMAESIYSRTYNADGSAAGDEVTVSQNSGGRWYQQNEPNVAALSNGKYVISWSAFSQDSSVVDQSGYHIRAQIFNADGGRFGDEFEVNTTTNRDQWGSEPAALADGKFVITWEDVGGGEVRAQIYNADGSTSGSEILVNTTTDLGQSETKIAVLTNGNFVITWTDQSQFADPDIGRDIRAQMFSADGSKLGDEFVVNPQLLYDGLIADAPAENLGVGTQDTPSITALSDGRFVISWKDTGLGDFAIYYGQVFNSDGTKSGYAFPLSLVGAMNLTDVSLLDLGNDKLFVTYTGRGVAPFDDNGTGIFANTLEIGTPGETVIAGNTMDGFLGTDEDDTFSGLGGFDMVFAGAGDDTLRGNTGDDLIYGGDGRDYVNGGFGDDMLSGDAGDDQVRGGRGNDMIVGGDGNDTLSGNDGNDQIGGGSGADVIRGGSGDDTILGEAGRDTLFGGDGIDVIGGGDGNDRIKGGNDRDQLSGDGGDDQIRGGKSNDTLDGGDGNDLLAGDKHNDRLNGGAGDDDLRGGMGNDVLRGDAGEDILLGGVGHDRLFGGDDADTFLFKSINQSTVGDDRDVIGDFAAGDTIDLSGIDAIRGAGRDDAFTFIGTSGFSDTAGELRYSSNSSLTVIQGDIDGDGNADFEIELTGSYTLTESDFVL